MIHLAKLLPCTLLALGSAPAFLAVQDPEPPPRPGRIERLEALVKESPDDVVLLGRLGRAYLMDARSGETGKIPAMIELFERARELDPEQDHAFELGFAHMLELAARTRAGRPDAEQLECLNAALGEVDAGLAKRPADAALVSMRGMAQVLKGLIAEDPELFGPGFAGLDRGVALAPAALHPRLARGFTLMGFPPEAGQNEKVVDDLEALLLRVGPMRNAQAAGMLQVFLGDVLLEMGREELAVVEYGEALELESTAAAEARSRLQSLEETGAVDPAAIRRFRNNRIQCASCHGRPATLDGR